MKQRYIIAAVALPLLFGCAKEFEKPAPSGPQVIRACIEQPVGTRVSFDATGKFSWNTGDKIAVHVGSAFVFNVEVDPSAGDITIEETATNRRNFYAVYPSSAAIEDATLQVSLPTSYDFTPITEGGDPSDLYRWTEEYSPVPMIAENDPDQAILYFRHIGGLLRIVCKEVPAGTRYAKVVFDNDVTGTYTVDVTNPQAPTIVNRGSASPAECTVTYKVSDSGLAADTPFVLNIPVPCGTYNNVTLSLYSDPAGSPLATPMSYTDGLTFARHHGKLLIFGDGVYTFVLGELVDVTTEYTGGLVELADAFESYRTDGTYKSGAPFVFEYSADGASGWTTTTPSWLSMDSNIDYNGYTSPQALSISIKPQPNQAVDVHGNALKAKTPVGTDANPVDLSLYNVATGNAVSMSTANCYVVQAPGVYKFPLVYGNSMNLGSYNQTANNSRRLAGGSWGWRTADWSPAGHDPESTGENAFIYLAYYKDHLDKNVFYYKGYPDVPASNSTRKDHAIDLHLTGKTLTAKLIWTDAEGLVSEDPLKLKITGSGMNRNNLTEFAYLQFEVPAETICQGNALIAVLADGLIAWSWHIWVTDDDLTAPDATSDGSNGYKFAPYNIGWCDPRETDRYDERKVYVRARQTGAGGLTSTPVLVTAKAGRHIVIGGHSPLFQWGRKDPLTPGYLVYTDGTPDVVEKPYYYTADYESEPKVVFGPHVSLGTAIQHPYVRYYYQGPLAHGWNWTKAFYINLWNAEIHGYGIEYSDKPTTKTMYDPSPVGYRVPHRGAYSTFDGSNFVIATQNGDPGRIFNGKVFFPEAGYRTDFDVIMYDFAKYWSTTMEGLGGDYRSGYSLAFNPSYPYPAFSSSPDFALPVRPIKEY